MEIYKYHDVLAELGVGSAHPGGFQSTIEWCRRLRPYHLRVLEIGCGTGRTSCFLAKQFGCLVTGIDVRPKMIEKARRRAVAERVQTRFLVEDVLNGELWPNSFDLVVAESVTVFLPIKKAFTAYRRQLRQGGVLIDVEMARRKRIPVEVRKRIKQLYGATLVPSAGEWQSLCEEAGFGATQILLEQGVALNDQQAIESRYPDLHQEVTTDALEKRSTMRVLEENVKVMRGTAGYLNSVMMIARR